MKASELRIGNLVVAKSPERQEWESPVVVTIGYLEMFSKDKVHFKPLQLTRELLLNLGFVECGYEGLEWRHEKLKGLQFAGINWADEEFPEYQFLTYEIGEQIYQISYVHQLQNLFFILTGEELTFRSE